MQSVDMVDESEVLTPADEFHNEKTKFTIPFVCGARNLGEALRRIKEGAAMIWTKGEAGTGDVSQAVLHMRMIHGGIRSLKGKDELQLIKVAREIEADYDLVLECARLQRLPVVNFATGGVAYACRCRADDAALSRWRIRGIWHLQIRESKSHGIGYCSGGA